MALVIYTYALYDVEEDNKDGVLIVSEAEDRLTPDFLRPLTRDPLGIVSWRRK